jgi:hypothetical protein
MAGYFGALVSGTFSWSFCVLEEPITLMLPHFFRVRSKLVGHNLKCNTGLIDLGFFKSRDLLLCFLVFIIVGVCVI